LTTKDNRVWWDVAGIALLAATATVLLAAPAFPSQDGPVHLYYIDILRGLLTHTGPYPASFQLKTLLTPYALQYYSMLALETVLPPLVSEKVLLCGYIFAFGLGFRYLVEAVSEERHNPWSLVGIPFCMNMLVYLGFVNYCFGVALTLWLAGLWIRGARGWTRGRVAALLAVFLLLLLAHPIPVAVFLLFAGLHYAVEAKQWLERGQKVQWLPAALLVAMAVMGAGWIGMFVGGADNGPALPSHLSQFGIGAVLMGLIAQRAVSPIRWIWYWSALGLLAAVAAMVLVQSPWKKDGRWRPAAIALAGTGAICFALYAVVPPQINDTWYFAERFPIFGVLFMIAGAAALVPRWEWSRLAGGLAVLVTLGVVGAQWVTVRRIAGEMRPAMEAPVAKAGAVGLVIGPFKGYPAGLAFDPYMWAGVHYFRRSKAILANTPWMDQTHILLGPVHEDRWSYLDPDGEAAKFGDSIPGIDFVMIEGPDDGNLERLVERVGLREVGSGSAMVKVFGR
jgi:hypothetical protein